MAPQRLRVLLLGIAAACFCVAAQAANPEKLKTPQTPWSRLPQEEDRKSVV